MLNINSEKWLHGWQKSLDTKKGGNEKPRDGGQVEEAAHTSVLEGLRCVTEGGGEGWEIQGLGLGKPEEARPQGGSPGEAELLLRLTETLQTSLLEAQGHGPTFHWPAWATSGNHKNMKQTQG